jgi:hypothetical protein
LPWWRFSAIGKTDDEKNDSEFISKMGFLLIIGIFISPYAMGPPVCDHFRLFLVIAFAKLRAGFIFFESISKDIAISHGIVTVVFWYLCKRVFTFIKNKIFQNQFDS